MHERQFIESILSKTAKLDDQVTQGIGDDCAVLSCRTADDWLVTTDMLVENVHFNLQWHSPYLLGRKSLAVNVSDIAAMAGMPRFVLLSLAIPPGLDDAWLSAFVDGLSSMLNEQQCALIGGDTVAASQFTCSITVLGTAVHGLAVGRGGASPGDSIYVSGNLGSAAAGLHLCKRLGYTVSDTQHSPWPELMQCHLDPIPQVQLARDLLETGCVSAMQDISDGVATDLSHICQASGVSALINAQSLPGHLEMYQVAERFGMDPLDFQLRGGEDYQLLFTVRGEMDQEFQYMVAQLTTAPFLSRIGAIGEGQGVMLQTQTGEKSNIAFQGYEHSS